MPWNSQFLEQAGCLGCSNYFLLACPPFFDHRVTVSPARALPFLSARGFTPGFGRRSRCPKLGNYSLHVPLYHRRTWQVCLFVLGYGQIALPGSKVLPGYRCCCPKKGIRKPCNLPPVLLMLHYRSLVGIHQEPVLPKTEEMLYIKSLTICFPCFDQRYFMAAFTIDD